MAPQDGVEAKLDLLVSSRGVYTGTLLLLAMGRQSKARLAYIRGILENKKD